ncbi:MAG TPA: CAP domain-containing protein [Dissulfurispiraceae bacterium]|nr:CAP domain-containing protein [Dissulfurispiraceae bacterium]
MKRLLTYERLVTSLLIAFAMASCGAHQAIQNEHATAGLVAIRTSMDPGMIETLVFQMVNAERKKNGLPRLEWDVALAELARRHSHDMARRGVLSHTNSNGEDPTARAKKKGISVTKREGSITRIGIAENVGTIPEGNLRGYGPVRSERDVADAMMKNWLSSPQHRANILNPRLDVIGVGVSGDGRGTYYLTQDFR